MSSGSEPLIKREVAFTPLTVKILGTFPINTITRALFEKQEKFSFERKILSVR